MSLSLSNKRVILIILWAVVVATACGLPVDRTLQQDITALRRTPSLEPILVATSPAVHRAGQPALPRPPGMVERDETAHLFLNDPALFELEVPSQWREATTVDGGCAAACFVFQDSSLFIREEDLALLPGAEESLMTREQYVKQFVLDTMAQMAEVEFLSRQSLLTDGGTSAVVVHLRQRSEGQVWHRVALIALVDGVSLTVSYTVPEADYVELLPLINASFQSLRTAPLT